MSKHEPTNDLLQCGECNTCKSSSFYYTLGLIYRYRSPPQRSLISIVQFQTIKNNSEMSADHDGSLDGVDMATHPTAQKLAARSLEFLNEVKNL